MAKPNYAFAKRQRDLAKKKKKEEKRLRKAGGPDDSAAESQAESSAEGQPDSDSPTVTRQQPEDSVS